MAQTLDGAGWVPQRNGPVLAEVPPADAEDLSDEAVTPRLPDIVEATEESPMEGALVEVPDATHEELPTTDGPLAEIPPANPEDDLSDEAVTPRLPDIVEAAEESPMEEVLMEVPDATHEELPTTDGPLDGGHPEISHSAVLALVTELAATTVDAPPLHPSGREDIAATGTAPPADSLAPPLPEPPAADASALSDLPAEWETLDAVGIGGTVVDHVVVGPNGVFTITLDPDPAPASLEEDGLYRDGSRVTATVKTAVEAAHALRQSIGSEIFAYPLLVTAVEGEPGCLDRLAVVSSRHVANAIWSHPGSPLTRSMRAEAISAIESLTDR